MPISLISACFTGFPFLKALPTRRGGGDASQRGGAQGRSAQHEARYIVLRQLGQATGDRSAMSSPRQSVASHDEHSFAADTAHESYHHSRDKSSLQMNASRRSSNQDDLRSSDGGLSSNGVAMTPTSNTSSHTLLVVPSTPQSGADNRSQTLAVPPLNALPDNA